MFCHATPVVMMNLLLHPLLEGKKPYVSDGKKIPGKKPYVSDEKKITGKPAIIENDSSSFNIDTIHPEVNKMGEGKGKYENYSK